MVNKKSLFQIVWILKRMVKPVEINMDLVKTQWAKMRSMKAFLNLRKLCLNSSNANLITFAPLYDSNLLIFYKDADFTNLSLKKKQTTIESIKRCVSHIPLENHLENFYILQDSRKAFSLGNAIRLNSNIIDAEERMNSFFKIMYKHNVDKLNYLNLLCTFGSKYEYLFLFFQINHRLPTSEETEKFLTKYVKFMKKTITKICKNNNLQKPNILVYMPAIWSMTNSDKIVINNTNFTQQSKAEFEYKIKTILSDFDCLFFTKMSLSAIKQLQDQNLNKHIIAVCPSSTFNIPGHEVSSIIDLDLQTRVKKLFNYMYNPCLLDESNYLAI